MRRSLAVLATAVLAFPLVAAGEADDTLWFRSTDGDCAARVLSLSAEPGEGESACGYIGGTPLDEVFEEGKSFPADKDLLGFVLEDTAVTGSIEIGHDGAGGGSYEITITVKMNGKTAGSTTITEQTGGLFSSIFTYELALDEAFVGQEITKLSVEVLQGGVFLNSGYMEMDNSFINIPGA